MMNYVLKKTVKKEVESWAEEVKPLMATELEDKPEAPAVPPEGELESSGEG